MPSFDAVNYSLRPSKSIQRQIVFDGVRRLQADLHLEHLAYIGLGSIWFTDFVLAHKVLGVDDMVSIEASEVGFRRARFNLPYATVRVLPGYSYDVLPALFEDETIKARPWFVWLDYDGEFSETTKVDVEALVEHAPANTLLLLSFNGHEMKYGRAPDRPERLRTLFGSSVPDDLSKNACQDDRMQETLATCALDYMQSLAAGMSRPGNFLPAFRIIYKDTAPMVTVGGVLPAKGAARIAADIVNDPKWRCRPAKPIVAPHLTMREAATLQSQLPLPQDRSLSRAKVQELGFDLEEEQIETFQTYYRQYPAFAQILT